MSDELSNSADSVAGGNMAQLPDLVGQLGRVTQQQSAIAALLGAANSKQAGGGGGGFGGLGFGSALGLATRGLAFMDRFYAPGTASVGKNEDTWKRMQQEGLAAQTPSGRVESAIRKRLTPAMNAVANAFENGISFHPEAVQKDLSAARGAVAQGLDWVLSGDHIGCETFTHGDQDSASKGMAKTQGMYKRGLQHQIDMALAARNGNGPVDHGSKTP